MKCETQGALWDFIRYAEGLEAGKPREEAQMVMHVVDVSRFLEDIREREKGTLLDRYKLAKNAAEAIYCYKREVRDHVETIAGHETWKKAFLIAFPPDGKSFRVLPS